jgi:hypothetical protein
MLNFVFASKKLSSAAVTFDSSLIMLPLMPGSKHIVQVIAAFLYISLLVLAVIYPPVSHTVRLLDSSPLFVLRAKKQ